MNTAFSAKSVPYIRVVDLGKMLAVEGRYMLANRLTLPSAESYPNS